MVTQSRRILRNYRYWKCSKLHGLTQRVRKALTDNPNIPLSVWLNHPELLGLFFAAADKLDTVYHEALMRGILSIAAREALEREVVGYLDLIASLLEAAAVLTPDILLSSGFDVARERRTSGRAKPAPAALQLNAKSANEEVQTEEPNPA
ncbi:hypothetical protein GMSM_21410 [Geomonas sp. Red276]